MRMLPKPPIILCVDDDPDDQLMVLETIREIDSSIRVACAMNGVEALRYLERTKYDVGLPSLVLLDINMPLLNGKETLLRLKEDTVLQQVPVVMFTTSSHQEDKVFCLRNGASAFVTKPFKQADLLETMKSFLSFLKV